MCSVLLEFVIVITAIVSDGVLANPDTHDIIGTDHVLHKYAVVVTSHAGTVTGSLPNFSILILLRLMQVLVHCQFLSILVLLLL